ncbi:MAG: MerR family transcriptional regulator [Thermoanaerobaculia bacterium]|nr:MerR family transcriptional regulator [Thermoanaerobaculia bacterium]
METSQLVTRIQLARELGVATQTISAWSRQGWFPLPKRRLSARLIYYDRREVETAMVARAARR